MLSVLIPTYNYSIFPLVEKVHALLMIEKIPFEIICLDDGSKNEEANSENSKINSLSNCSFSELEKNIGRSSIRNLLAKKATYEWLLFLDADVFPKEDNFISKYTRYFKSDYEVIYGGIEYQQKTPSASQILRWKYGKAREALNSETRNKNPYISFLTLNFLIRKNVFSKVNFNEDIPNLRHEDTLFSYELKKEKIRILHIDNPVLHLGLETSEIFLKKSLESVEAAYFLEKENLIDPRYIKMNDFYNRIANGKLEFFLHLLGKHFFQKKIKNNLLSPDPSLKLYDLYRLLHLHKIKNA